MSDDDWIDRRQVPDTEVIIENTKLTADATFEVRDAVQELFAHLQERERERAYVDSEVLVQLRLLNSALSRLLWVCGALGFYALLATVFGK